MNHHTIEALSRVVIKCGTAGKATIRRKTGIFTILILLLLSSSALLGVTSATGGASAQPATAAAPGGKVVAAAANVGAGTGATIATTQKSGKVVQGACPPLTPINGILGSGSTDYPATSGQQTGRIVNGLGNVTCGSSNPCSLNTTEGSRTFDAYTFTNPGTTTACVTVSFEMTGCNLGQAMQFSARLGSFDPAAPCANYVADGGAGFSGEADNDFSFNVPAGGTFVVVVNENDPGGATGCAYKLTISGLECQQPPPCPPATAINGSIGQGSQDYPSTSGTQIGRITQNGVDSSCAAPKTCPGLGDNVVRNFDAYQFANDSDLPACVTFTFPQSCGVNTAVHPVAYLNSFDPANVCANYLGDIGHSISTIESGSFSVTVPANSIVVLVVHDNSTMPDCANYSFTVSGLPCQPGTPCQIACPSNITRGSDAGQCGAVVNYSSPTTAGNCGTVTCSPPSGSFFPVGTTSVTCTEANSAAACSFTVTVNDTVAPTIQCPANITQSNDPNQCSAVVNYPAPNASDNCPGAITVVCNPSSGSTFPVGTTTVNCTATDGSGNTANCSFTVTVTDTQPPVVTCPAPVTAVAPQTCPPQAGTVVTYAPPTATDNCTGVTVVCNPASGSTFPLGATTVTCTATDGSGNTATCSFTVTVFDGCLQDESNPANVVLFNTQTGEYRFCCGGVVIKTGIGTVTRQGCAVTIQHNTSDRRVTIRTDLAMRRGTASVQSPPGTIKCTITDKNILDNTCACQ